MSPITVAAIAALKVGEHLVEQISADRAVIVRRHAGALSGTSWLRVYVRDTSERAIRMPTVEKRDSRTMGFAMRSVALFRSRYGTPPTST